MIKFLFVGYVSVPSSPSVEAISKATLLSARHLCRTSRVFGCDWFCRLWLFKIHLLFIHSHAFVYMFLPFDCKPLEERKSICHFIYTFPWCPVMSSAHHRSWVNTIHSFSNCLSLLHCEFWLVCLFCFSSVVLLSFKEAENFFLLRTDACWWGKPGLKDYNVL